MISLKKFWLTTLTVASLAWSMYSNEHNNCAQKEIVTNFTNNLFCWMPIDQLTVGQKQLFDKLSSKELKDLAQRVHIDASQWQIQFPKINMAIKDKDLDKELTKSQTDSIVKSMWNGRKLPKDSNRPKNTDDPSTDFGKMISQMPGLSPNEKIENFMLLTGVDWFYWTSTVSNDAYDTSIVYWFDERISVSGWARDVNNKKICKVRLIKSIQ